ncbi:uncharacterized protein [Chelonus insularis]|uniref:uncharacterized protein n=1 Tax=Chelonus insularis TaxID=460826 RepID=UPI00158A3998|nr:uncharacterized protein LOC118069660 [Chelonus insularis]
MMGAKFPPCSTITGKVTCCVPNCDSRTDKNLELRFHKFPPENKYFVKFKNDLGIFEKTDAFDAWKKVLKMENVIPSMKVCSLHFQMDDYLLPRFPYTETRRRVLKRTAVPSCNLPIISQSEEAELRKNKKDSTKQEIKVDEDEIIYEEFLEDEEYLIDHGEIGDIRPESSTKHLMHDAQVQVDLGFTKNNFSNFITSNDELKISTGIESFEVLQTIVHIVEIKYGDKLKPRDVEMSICDRIIMTYVKLKQNLSYSFLAVLFKCQSEKDCQRIFSEMIKILRKCLNVVIKWPSKESISKNLPKCFEKYRDVRVLLDCIEIHIQQPDNAFNQMITHSTPEESRNCKFMIGVTPAENICYISRAYEGCTSDETIFANSDIMTLLERGDAIIGKSDFNIDNICELNGWKCYRPTLSEKAPKFNGSSTCDINKARVHVERSIQRIKDFKIVEKAISSYLIPLIKDMFMVICATVNLNSPYIKKDEFMETTEV